MRQIIIHISNDFPDILVPNKTKAVQHLVDGTPEFRHIVYSLNRVNGWRGMTSTPFGEDRTAIAYKALPKGLFWEARLKEVADFIINDLTAKNIIPDAIQGHKFTVEGLVAQQMSAHFKKPLMLSIQGDTDTKILELKRSLRKRFQTIADQAAMIFPFSIWPIAAFKKHLILNDQKIRVLPVVPAIDTLSPAPIITESRLMTVFHLDSWNRKNIIGVLNALNIVRKNTPSVHLDIYGSGSVKSTKHIQKLIADYGLTNSVSLMGPAPNGDLPSLMKKYAGFVLPSKRESYGLVFAESLFAGLPVLFPKDRAIDGFFPVEKIGYACDPFDHGDIAKAIDYLLTNQASLKLSIENMQNSGALDIIRKEHILSVYRRAIRDVLAAA